LIVEFCYSSAIATKVRACVDRISVGNFLVTGATVDVASPVSVPEPGTLPLMAAAMGAFGLVCARNRRVRSSARR
jgi:hypothetical protein